VRAELRPLGRVQEGLSETTVGALSLGPLAPITLSSCVSCIIEMVWEVTYQERERERKGRGA
jgi:hypothetical protein